MSSIGDILAGKAKKQYDEPPEIKIIKKYVRDKFQSDVTITIQPKRIVVSAKSSALAGTLRMHSYELSQLCDTNKRLVFRVG